MVEQTNKPQSSKNRTCPVCPVVAAAALPPPEVPQPRLVLVVVNGPKPEAVWRAHGTLDDQIRDSLTKYGLMTSDVQLEVVTSYEDHSPPLPSSVSKYAAVILGGSKFDVTDGAPWMFAMMDWIRANVSKVPMLGICFGHQIIGHALGGQAMKNPRGCEAGTYLATKKVQPLLYDKCDPIASHLPDAMPVHLLHGQSIERLPEGAVSFYDTCIERNQFVRFSPMVYGTQFHPEFTAATVVTYLNYCGSWNVPRTSSQLPKDSGVECEAANMIIGRFVELALSRGF